MLMYEYAMQLVKQLPFPKNISLLIPSSFFITHCYYVLYIHITVL
ncbi:putative membrane protein [Bacillus mycoides]|nr:putative membrane protein [Bacillus mycoides]